MAVQAPDVDTLTRNPLEPLSPDEIRRASELLREQRDLGPKVRFVTIGLHEPPKPAVVEHDRNGGPAPDREAFAILYDREHQQTIDLLSEEEDQPDTRAQDLWDMRYQHVAGDAYAASGGSR